MYYSTKSSDGPWDVIVVGSGMGGMTSAALLSRLGKRVLVLEQHYVPGGLTHSFRRKKWVWDIGVHTVAQVTEHSMVGRLLSKLTDGKLIWESLGPISDRFTYPDGFQIDFPSNPEQLNENLYSTFPDDRKAIDEYFHTCRQVSAAMRGYYLSMVLPKRLAALLSPVLGRKGKHFTRLRTSEVLDRITTNERLKAALTAQWGYYGSPPSRSSFAMHALVAQSFRYGGYYPRGGSKCIAESLLGPVTRAGGAVRVKAEVKEILIRRGKAIGVVLKDGEEIRAKKVISAVGALGTIHNLLPERERKKSWCRSINGLNPSPCHVSLYIGFKGDIRKAGAIPASFFFYGVQNHDIGHWDFRASDAAAPSIYVGFCSLRDPEHDPGPEQIHTGIVITFLPWEEFLPWVNTRWRKRGEDYEALKQELSDRLLEQLLKHMPELKPMIAYTELSTPLSTVHFNQSVKGSIYGLEPTPERFKNPYLRPQTPIKNLYLSGCDAGLPGVVGAMLGGVLSTMAAEPVKTLRYLFTARPGR